MNKILLLALFLFSFNIKARVASSAFKLPCEKIRLKVESCVDLTLTNKAHLNEDQAKRKDIVFVKKGALIKGSLINRGPVKCHKKQDPNFKGYKKVKLKESFFVDEANCTEHTNEVSVFRPNFFCDTPGTPTIFECYINKLKQEQSFEYTELLP